MLQQNLKEEICGSEDPLMFHVSQAQFHDSHRLQETNVIIYINYRLTPLGGPSRYSLVRIQF